MEIHKEVNKDMNRFSHSGYNQHFNSYKASDDIQRLYPIIEFEYIDINVQ